jgi:hypothetical protein
MAAECSKKRAFGEIQTSIDFKEFGKEPDVEYFRRGHLGGSIYSTYMSHSILDVSTHVTYRIGFLIL